MAYEIVKDWGTVRSRAFDCVTALDDTQPVNGGKYLDFVNAVLTAIAGGQAAGVPLFTSPYGNLSFEAFNQIDANWNAGVNNTQNFMLLYAPFITVANNLSFCKP